MSHLNTDSEVTESLPYTVDFDAGDPREPEYRNGLRVYSATYREGKLYLLFKLVGTRLGDSQDIEWRLEAPAYTRKALGSRWSERAVIFDRVAQRVCGLEQSDDTWAWFNNTSSRRFGQLSVDESKIPGWLSDKLEQVDKWLKPAQRFFPKRNVLLLWTIGCSAAYLAQSMSAPWLPLMLQPAMLVTTGLMTFILLIRDVTNTYPLMRMTWQLNLRKTCDPAPCIKALKSLGEVYGFRYSVSVAVAVLLIYLGVR